jgi:hypothetical protein
MTCDELRDSYELYALGVAEDPEQAEIRAHLSRACPICTGRLRQARELATLFGVAAEPAAPSPRLRNRILASVGVERPRFRWAPLWAAAAALSLFAAVYFGVRVREARDQIASLRARASGQSATLARVNQALAILSGPGTTEVSFGQGQPKPPRGKVFVNPERGVLLIASNLPPAPSGKAYEMWVIPKGGKPVPAGLFQSETGGTAVHVQGGAVDLASTAAVAVTLENEGGAPQPTSQPLIVAAL